MTGAIAGTAITNIEEDEKGKLNTVTLTVNDYCNLDCSHCYLRAGSNSKFVNEEVLRQLEQSDFSHLAIVGKEPLVNQRDADRTLAILRRFDGKGVTGSLITNGTGLAYVTEAPRNLSYIDVSFDGGPSTFKAKGKVTYSELASNIERLASSGVRINALQTLYGENVEQIDAMMRIREIEGLEMILFSPYLDTRNFGEDGVSRAGLSRLLTSLAESDRFSGDTNSVVLIDRYHIEQDNVSFDEIKKQIANHGLQDKVAVIEEDPLMYGIVRVTHDGLVLTPEQSLHVRDYTQLNWQNRLSRPLEETYERMVA